MTKEEFLKRLSEDEEYSPGWQAIDDAFEALYPGQKPAHFGTDFHARAIFGGDPLFRAEACYHLCPLFRAETCYHFPGPGWCGESPPRTVYPVALPKRKPRFRSRCSFGGYRMTERRSMT